MSPTLHPESSALPGPCPAAGPGESLPFPVPGKEGDMTSVGALRAGSDRAHSARRSTSHHLCVCHLDSQSSSLEGPCRSSTPALHCRMKGSSGSERCSHFVSPFAPKALIFPGCDHQSGPRCLTWHCKNTFLMLHLICCSLPAKHMSNVSRDGCAPKESHLN